MFKQLSDLIKTINVHEHHRGEISILVIPSGNSFRFCCRSGTQTEAEPVSRWFDSEEMYNAIEYLNENFAINKNENQGI
jgi:hypothetical protein